jgi:cation/acetate symporter
LYATGLIGYFYLIIPIVGFGAAALVGREVIRKVDAGGNMAAPLVAELLGGTPFLGFIAAVAFATILAVVAGLTLAGASALSHDIYTHAVRKENATEQAQIRVARGATIGFGVGAVLLGILFKGQNVAFMVGLAFAVAASANFPPLLLSIVWRRFNTMGAVCAIAVGAALSVALIVLSPTIWVDLLHKPHAIFPLRNPAIVSMPASFLCGIVASLLTREPSAEARFDDEKLRTYLGVGAE